MRLGINFRGDLAKLSDEELAAELNRFCEYGDARFGSKPPVGSLKGQLLYGPEWFFGRGPVHQRLAYKVWIGYFLCFRGPRGTQYLVECEIKDLQDEYRRRLGTTPWAER